MCGWSVAERKRCLHSLKRTQVAAHACAAHETALAAELLASLPRRGPPGTGRRSPQQHPSAVWPPGAEASGNGVAGVFLSGGGGRLFAFQRSFLEARAELLRLLGACWGMCQVWVWWIERVLVRACARVSCQGVGLSLRVRAGCLFCGAGGAFLRPSVFTPLSTQTL